MNKGNTRRIMNQIEIISENSNCTAINVGSMDKWNEYSIIFPISRREVKGKIFLKDATQATGTEISLNSLPSKAELPDFHFHKKNEETYIILRGSGLFLVDDDSFPIEEGSVIRVAPEGKRCITNTSDSEMLFICIQSKAGSLEEYTIDDGEQVSIKGVER